MENDPSFAELPSAFPFKVHCSLPFRAEKVALQLASSGRKKDIKLPIRIRLTGFMPASLQVGLSNRLCDTFGSQLMDKS